MLKTDKTVKRKVSTVKTLVQKVSIIIKIVTMIELIKNKCVNTRIDHF